MLEFGTAEGSHCPKSIIAEGLVGKGVPAQLSGREVGIRLELMNFISPGGKPLSPDLHTIHLQSLCIQHHELLLVRKTRYADQPRGLALGPLDDPGAEFGLVACEVDVRAVLQHERIVVLERI